jgi:hypothetical protein
MYKKNLFSVPYMMVSRNSGADYLVYFSFNPKPELKVFPTSVKMVSNHEINIFL